MALWNINEDLVNGDKLLLYLTSGHTVIAYATSCSVQVDSEEIDISSKFSCRWHQALNGKANYSISVDALYCNAASGISFDDLLAMMVDGEAVDWYMGQESAWTGSCEDNPHTLDTSAPYYNGKAVVTSVSLEAGNGEMCTCSATLTGAGEIMKNGSPITS